MCGICGIISLCDSRPVSLERLKSMTAALAHRGPDDEGYFHSPQAGLGSRRLSIIDLAGGRMPIANEDGSLQIIFNGEIYNFPELRQFTSKKGHSFRTDSDTEVILHLYEEFGANALQYLSGIFAIAIWDLRRRRLFLARDRMGVKPLYYWASDKELMFASELKSLMANQDLSREVDYNSLSEYLSYEYVPTPNTILKDVYRLEPGSYLLFDQKALAVKSYWRLSLGKSESHPAVDWRDYVQAADQILRQAVKQELVSDVPVGVFLSGGVDSSVIAALMAETYPGTVQSFSIGFNEPSFDESRYSRLMANRLGTDHNELIVDASMALGLIPSLCDFLDEPFGDSSIIPSYFLSKLTSEKVKVVLAGDGGDELFAGYPTLVGHRLIQYFEALTPWKLRALVVPRVLEKMPVSFENLSLDFKLRRFFSGRGVSLLARHHRWLGSFTDQEKDLLIQDWLKSVLRDTYTQSYLHDLECDARLALNRILYNDLKMYLEGDILFKVDRASMANSLEVRVPLLNKSVVDFALALPLDLKLRRLTSKYLFKKVASRLVPREIVHRPKKGFNIPVAQWLANELKELASDLFAEGHLRQQGLFQPAAVQQLMQQHLEGKRDNRKQLWTLLVFQLWYERYLK